MRIDDVAAVPHSDGMRYNILLRKSKADQEGRQRYMPLRAQMILTIEKWINAAKFSEEPILRSIDQGENIGSTLGSG